MASRGDSQGCLGWLVAGALAIVCECSVAAARAQEEMPAGDESIRPEMRRAAARHSDSGPLAMVLEPPATVAAAIGRMSRAAGVIFAGEVMAVRRPAGYAGSGEDAAEGVVEIDFRVEEAVLGLEGSGPGRVYTLREWAGLWSGNSERYRVGQRLLMFLRKANAGGFTSPVHGSDGAIPLRGGGIAPGRDDVAAGPAVEGADGWMADLRWVETQVLRREIWIEGAGLGPVPEPIPEVAPVPGQERCPQIDLADRKSNSRSFDSADHDEAVICSAQDDTRERSSYGASAQNDNSNRNRDGVSALELGVRGPGMAGPQLQDALEPLAKVIALCVQAVRFRDAAE